MFKNGREIREVG